MSEILERVVAYGTGELKISRIPNVRPVDLSKNNITVGHVDVYFYEATKVVVSSHAIERWTERVALNYTKEEIQRTLEVILLYCPSRLTYIDKSKLLVDNDILIEYAVSENYKVVTVVTILGRLKNSPDLLFIINNPDYVRTRGEQLDLGVPIEILSSDIRVDIPHSVALWSVSDILRSAEVYEIEGSDTPLILLSEIGQAKKLRVNNAWFLSKGLTERVHISNLGVLYKLGAKKEVLEYLRKRHFTELTRVLTTGDLEPILSEVITGDDADDWCVREILDKLEGQLIASY